MWYIRGGIYLDGYNLDEFEWEACPGISRENEDGAEREAYAMAYEKAEGWVGMHGFCEYDEDEFLTEEEETEQINEDIEMAIDYEAKWFDEGVDPNAE